MKGIVLDLKDRDAAVLLENGEIHRMQDRGYRIGQTITINRHRSYSYLRWVASIAAALVIFTTGAFAYTTPAGYVSLDVNPSVEYSINIFDRVLEVKAVNDDGEEILERLDLKNKSITKAIEETTASLIEHGYITEEEDNGIIITTCFRSEEDALRLADRLREQVQNRVEEEGKDTPVEATAVGQTRVDEAKVLGVTPGKLNLVEKLLESSQDTSEIDREEFLDEWLDKPVKEINKMIKENRQSTKSRGNDGEDNSDDALRNHGENGKNNGNSNRERTKETDVDLTKQNRESNQNQNQNITESIDESGNVISDSAITNSPIGSENGKKDTDDSQRARNGAGGKVKK